MHDEHQIPIWFFIGGLLLIYGILITRRRPVRAGQPSPAEARVSLFELHADVWWGALMTIVGLAYCLRFNPRRNAP